MSVRLLQSGLMLSIAAGLAVSAWIAAGTPILIPDAPPRAPHAGERSPQHPLRVADSLIAGAARRPMFRPDRHQAPVGFEPSAGAVAPETAPPPVPRPQLYLSGVVWGTDPAAIVEGLPGAGGARVLRRGELAAGIRLVRIERERVTLAGDDTTWTLQVREPWR